MKKSILENKWRFAFICICVGLVVIAGAGAYYFFMMKGHGGQRILGNHVSPTPPPAPKAVKALIKTVEEKIHLPTDETPTVATITDPARLQDQAFFAKAQKGDKVLIYAGAQKAFLFRPSTNEVIHVSKLDIIEGEASTSAEKSVSDSGKNDPSVLKVKF